ncbi:hypothetical protein [Amycolatopsis panacis]|uniref:PPE domain-containing protein n=1 Tax=Amycolatopsis panacis TaxID=2340917 RepID=A0A419HRA5_9PSEU|nr:hypothetical protein [Amycolatopsis panacis]RJQ79102.1 hypothetical protein D5S19_26905 [Amycolatopsis panacis]
MSRLISGGFKGAASDEAVSNACVPLMQASMDDSVHLEVARTAANDQMAAFQTAKNSVKPVSAQQPELTGKDIMNTLTGWGESYATKVGNWKADSQHNVEVYAGYHGSSGTNSGRVPEQYAQLTDGGAPVSLAGADDPGTHHGPGPGPGKDGVGGPGHGGPGTSVPGPIIEHGPGPGRQPVGGPPAGGPPPVGGPPGRQPPPDNGTKKDSWTPPIYTPGPPVFQPPAGPPMGPPGGLPVDPPGLYGGPPGFGPIGSAPGGSGAGGSGGGYRGGAGSAGGLGGEPGARGGSGTGSGAGAGARSGSGVPGESGPVRGGAAASGAAGKNGTTMGGGMGAKGGKGEEDKEKKAASYLQEADPDGLFGGSDVKPTPPVIGEIPRRQ